MLDAIPNEVDEEVTVQVPRMTMAEVAAEWRRTRGYSYDDDCAPSEAELRDRYGMDAGSSR